jgi:hypothetical protein
MSYVGNEPAEKYSSLTQQTFSSPTGTSFTLDQSVTSSVDIALFIDNVRQDPTTYTATGTSLTTSTISSPSTMYCLFNGKTTETVAPPANSVDSGNVVSGAIDDSHISGLAASKLTGTIADARFPATLPAASGVNLTALNATNLGSGTVPTARLGSGTASSSTFLRGDQTYAEAGGGAWTLIGTQVASNDASLTQTGLSSTYQSYAIVLSDVTIATNAAHVVFRIGDSGGIDSGTSDYKYHTMASNTNVAGYAAENSAGASYVVIGEYIGNASGRGYHGIVFLGNHTSLYPTIHGNYGGIDNSGFGTGSSFFGLRDASITVDRVQVLCSSGNLLTGRFTVYGIKHT